LLPFEDRDRPRGRADARLQRNEVPRVQDEERRRREAELKAANTPLKADSIVAIKMRGDELRRRAPLLGDDDILMARSSAGDRFNR
jgi:hypothetical protein